MEKNTDRILWVVLILSISVGLGLIYLNHSPRIMSEVKNTIGSIVDKVDGGSDSNLANEDDNSPFTYQYDTNAKTAIITGYKSTSGNNLPANLEIPAYNKHNGVKYTVTSIGEKAFYRVSAPAQGVKVTLPDTIKTIGISAFFGDSLTSINLPEGLVYIGDDAFSNNKLTNVTIPSTLATIGAYAFSSNAALTSVDMSNATHLTSIQNHAFGFNSKLASLRLPLNGKLSSIEGYSFCLTGLSKVEIPASVMKIGYQAFWHVAKGASVVIHSPKGAITYAVDYHGKAKSTTPAPLTFSDGSNSPLTPTYVTD